MAERLARSGVVSLAGSGFAALAALLLTSVVGNQLGASGTGLFFQAMGIFTILTQVLRLGTNSGIVRFIAEQRAFDRAGGEWRIVLIALIPVAVVSGLAALVLWFFAGTLAGWLATPQEADGLTDLLQAMAPYVVLGAVLGVLHIVTRMLRGVTAFTVLQSVLLPASRLVSVLVVTVIGTTAWAAFEAWLVPLPFWLVVTVLVIASPLARDIRRRGELAADDRPAAGTFWRFNAPRTVSQGFETALEWADVLIVAALASPATAGIYAVLTRAVRAGALVDRAMRVAVSPTISALLARGDREGATRLHTTVVRAMVLMTWPFHLSLITLGSAVLAIFGPEFVVGHAPMVLLAVAMMFQSAAGMLQSILLQGGRSTWQMGNKAVALTLSIGGNLLTVGTWGLWGAAVTWFVVVVVDNLLAAFQVHRRMQVRLRPRQVLTAAVIPLLVFGLGGWALSGWVGTDLVRLVIAVACLGLIHVAVLWVLRRRLSLVTLWRRFPVIGRFA